MTQRLIIYIDENWPEQASAPWVLLDERDRLVEEGNSEPRHWPAADICEVVLGATQASWLQTQLPRTAQRHLDRVLRYALENQLVKDVEDQHFTITHRSPSGDGITADVLVVGRSRLRRLIAQLDVIGRKPSRMVSELQSSPLSSHPGDVWTLTAGPTGAIVIRYGEQRAIATEAAFAEDILTHLLQQARSDNRAPQALEIHVAANAALPPEIDAAALQASTGLTCQTKSRRKWWRGMRSASDLLHGEFAPKGVRTPFTGLRGPLWLTAAACVIWLTISFGGVIWQRSQLHTAEARIQRLFEAALPNTPPISPSLQLNRALDEIKSQHGLLRGDDFLSLLAVYGEIRGSGARHSINALEYDNGTLRITLKEPDDVELAVIQARFAALGYNLSTSGDNARRIALTVRSQP